ncbi:hypothetical protein SCP_1002070 [Sparassis crispa]|uniref:Uncharacterized protein n=1 Tax=Sparassis crispa TaxID=139825 RepID=A0A401GXP3_9APHY|nr:hypothetical protein SCP_1002070 [Sparassis crispa]GBE86962.1 hypothetical protein SCP_1002070 [Sparassis crispa]
MTKRSIRACSIHAPQETVGITSICDSARSRTGCALVQLVHTRVDTPRYIQRCGPIKIAGRRGYSMPSSSRGLHNIPIVALRKHLPIVETRKFLAPLSYNTFTQLTAQRGHPDVVRADPECVDRVVRIQFQRAVRHFLEIRRELALEDGGERSRRQIVGARRAGTRERVEREVPVLCCEDGPCDTVIAWHGLRCASDMVIHGISKCHEKETKGRDEVPDSHAQSVEYGHWRDYLLRARSRGPSGRPRNQDCLTGFVHSLAHTPRNLKTPVGDGVFLPPTRAVVSQTCSHWQPT